MCGICGQFSVDPTPVDRELWDSLLAAMFRRGPDGSGTVFEPHAVLAVQRLSILDLSAGGHLPMQDENGRFSLAFNGELYNYRELRALLQLEGFEFRSSGDSEVVLRAMQRWGIDALARFNGMFVFAFYDRDNQKLTLARDHAGIKPVYVLEDKRGIVFASQFEQIMTHPWALGRAIDAEAVAMYLRLGYIPAPRALLRGTQMMEPGSWLEINRAGVITRGRYYRFSGNVEGLDRPDDDELESAFRQAVISQSVSDAPIGCFLSGGIDSPLIASCMQEGAFNPVPGFSVGFEAPGLDESADAARYARRIGVEHHHEMLKVAHQTALIAEMIEAMHEPIADEGIIPSLFVAGMAHTQVKVALSGEGGDELFWGYFERHAVTLSCLLEKRPSLGAMYQSFFSKMDPRKFNEVFPGLPWWPSGEPAFEFDASDPVTAGQLLRRCELEVYLPFILLKTDRASMHHSLEVRVPFLDRRVIEVASRLDFHDCLDFASRLGKLPVRRVLQKRTGLATAGKRGFAVPMGNLLRTSLRDSLHESLRSLRGLESVEVDRTALARLEDAHLATRENHATLLWRVFCLDRWLRKDELRRK